jgi:hypothetical protein
MAYNFNGTNQYLSCAAPLTGLVYPYTFACHFKPNNITDTGVMVQIGPANGNYWGLLNAGSIAGDPVVANHSAQAAAVGGARSTAGYTANDFFHACGIFESASLKKAYLNGANEGTNTAAIFAASSATELLIGARRAAGALGTYYGGIIAEVGIWSAALTAAEVASLAKGMTCDKVRPQSLVFYAPLVRDLIDAKGGLTITNKNSATVANHPRVYA